MPEPRAGSNSKARVHPNLKTQDFDPYKFNCYILWRENETDYKSQQKTFTKLTSLLGLLSFDCLAKQVSCTLTDFMFLFQLPKERSVSGLPQAKHGPLIESREITLIDTYHPQIVLNTKEY